MKEKKSKFKDLKIKDIHFEMRVFSVRDADIDLNIHFTEKGTSRIILIAGMSYYYKAILKKETRKLIESLNEIKLYNWKRSYKLDKDYVVLDGESWKLHIIYENGVEQKCHGENAYPSSYEKLIDLIHYYIEKLDCPVEQSIKPSITFWISKEFPNEK